MNMVKDMTKLLEYYEKCRVLIKALDCNEMDEADKDALLWMLEEKFEMLGEMIRTIEK